MTRRIFVDAMNVIGSRPDGWWRDRDAAKRKLGATLAKLAAEGIESGDGSGSGPTPEITVVFDGREPTEPIEAPGASVEFAPGGPNAADDWIVSLLEADDDPASVEVITSDADLARRAGDLGATVTGASAFRRTLDTL